MKRAILVLGPPRSGTSALSHVLSKLGIEFGNPEHFVDPEINAYNPIFFELRALNDLNDEIFRFFSKTFGDFDWLPERGDFDERVVSHFEPQITQLIEAEFSDPQTIGFKDPRFCYTLPLWDEVLQRMGFAVSYVLTRRAPDAVFTSNAIINRSSDAANFRLVVQSWLLARQFVEEKRFVTIRYEDLLAQPEATIARLCEKLDLNPALADDARAVIRNELNHQPAPPEPQLYRYFAHVADFDSISADEYTCHREIYSAAVSDKNQKIDALNNSLSHAEAQIASLNQVAEERQVRLSTLVEAVSAHAKQIDALDQSLAGANETIADRDTQIAALGRAYLESQQQQGWRMADLARFAKRHLRRFKKAARMSAVLLRHPLAAKTTVLDVRSTKREDIEERLHSLRSGQFDLQVATEPGRSPAVVRQCATFAILLLRFKQWRSVPRWRRLSSWTRRVLQGDMQPAASANGGRFQIHVDTPTGFIKFVNGSFVVSGWSIDLANRAAAKVRIRVGKKVYFPELKTREDVQRVFRGTCELPADTGFSSAPAVPMGLHRLRIDLQHDDGVWISARRIFLLRAPSLWKRKSARPRFRYSEWVRHEQASLERELPDIRRHLSVMLDMPEFTVVVDTRQGSRGLDSTIESVRKQLYPHWDLRCLSDPSNEPRPDALNDVAELEDPSLSKVRSEFIVFLKSGQRLAVNALYEFAAAVNRESTADLIYGDEDTWNALGRRCDPFYKPDWSPDYLESFHYIGFPACYRTAVARGCFDSSHAYDFVLRFTERTTRVLHIAKILGHDMKALAPRSDGAIAKDIAALQGRLARTSRRGTVESHDLHSGCYRIRPELTRRPLVSIVIPTAAQTVTVGDRQVDLIDNVITQIRERSTYERIEIVVVDNGDLTPSQVRTLDRWNCQRITYLEPIFNVSKKLNLGASIATGDFLMLMNDDIEILTPSWIEGMLAQFEKPHVGVVGAKLLYPNGQTQHSGVVHNFGNPDHVRRGCLRDEAGYYFSTCGVRNYLAVTGACMLTPANIFRKVGGYSEELAISYNDVDYCLKVRSEGGWTVYAPDVELTHMESMSRVPVADVRETAWYHRRWAEETMLDPFYNEQFLAVAPPTFEPFVNQRTL